MSEPRRSDLTRADHPLRLAAASGDPASEFAYASALRSEWLSQRSEMRRHAQDLEDDISAGYDRFVEVAQRWRDAGDPQAAMRTLRVAERLGLLDESQADKLRLAESLAEEAMEEAVRADSDALIYPPQAIVAAQRYVELGHRNEAERVLEAGASRGDADCVVELSRLLAEEHRVFEALDVLYGAVDVERDVPTRARLFEEAAAVALSFNALVRVRADLESAVELGGDCVTKLFDVMAQQGDELQIFDVVAKTGNAYDLVLAAEVLESRGNHVLALMCFSEAIDAGLDAFLVATLVRMSTLADRPADAADYFDDGANITHDPTLKLSAATLHARAGKSAHAVDVFTEACTELWRTNGMQASETIERNAMKLGRALSNQHRHEGAALVYRHAAETIGSVSLIELAGGAMEMSDDDEG